MPTAPLRAHLDQVQQRAFMIGGVFFVLTLIGAFVNREQFFRSYLVSYLFWNGITLGSFAILMIHHMVGGKWGFAIRRLLESATRVVPIMLVLMLPLLFGLHSLYEWARPEEVAHDALLRHKQPYLNVPFFLVRVAICYAIWMTLSYFLNKWSAEQDRTGDPDLMRKLQNLSGAGLLLYGLTVTFSSID